MLTTQNISAREDTFFSQERFIQAVARTETAKVRALTLQCTNSPAHLFALERTHRFNRRSVSLAPFGFCAYPIHAEGADDCVPLLVAQLKTFRTIDFDWNVRFDHAGLASQLEGCGLTRIEGTTRVLHIDRPYDALLSGFGQSTRNKIRQAQRKGVVVRRTTDSSDLAAFYTLYKKLNAERNTWNWIYSEGLYEALLKLEDDAILLVAELNGTIIGGAGFIRDGNSMYYWIGSMNYEFKQYFSYYAIMNYAILLACNEGMKTFNMGASASASIEQFKSFWGTQKVPYWRFVWKNPIWRSISYVHGRLSW